MTPERKSANGHMNEDLGDVLVVGGGIIPQEDIAGLRKAGIKAIFGPGTNTGEIVEFIRSNARSRD